MKHLNKALALKVLLISVFLGIQLSFNCGSAQTLSNGSWWRVQLDKFNLTGTTMLFKFRKNNTVSNVNVGESTTSAEGVYIEKNDSLHMRFDNLFYLFTVKWVNVNKVKLLTGKRTLLLSVYESNEDTFDADLKAGKNIK